MYATIPLPPPATGDLRDLRGIPGALADTARAVLDPSGLGGTAIPLAHHP